MTETKVVEILNRDGQIERCNIEYDPAGAITIKCQWPGVLEKHQFSSRDFFEAVVLFREELERIGSRLLCMAARIDFFPSGIRSFQLSAFSGSYKTVDKEFTET